MALWAPPIWQQIVYSVLFIPVVEEVLFRRIVFRILRRWIRFSGAMVVSAVLFGAYHGNLVQFVYATFCGVLLAYLYEKYASILAPIISHMTMNAVAVILTHLGVFAWISQSVVRALILIIICAVIAVLFLRFVHKMDVTKVLKMYCKDTSNDI
jgi:membrane protease YdiL (CAAX protease family)